MIWSRWFVLAGLWLALYAVFSSRFPKRRYGSIENNRPKGFILPIAASTIAWAMIAFTITRLYG
jgi:hypothetical protein